MTKFRFISFVGLLLFVCALKANGQSVEGQLYKEKWRPQFHHSPSKNWMNDPNGMVYFDGEYHLFYQHDLYEKIFGDMSWGHAVSKDLVHWRELPKAIVPDSDNLGFIFSGSTVVDKDNTAGLGANTLVAIYTSTNPQQQQCMAYSTDKGRTWIKYKGNPIIKNEHDDNIPADFRDPKVMWHAASQKWIMSLAVQDHIEFWSSSNLKDWMKESEFGKELGAHGGVWECPDLFELSVDGDKNDKRWVLLVSINPGGPNGGSATQYFVGDFDGKKFVVDSKFQEILGVGKGVWMDSGTDNYACVTWSNTQNRRIALGWMSNWQYAGNVPTKPWRGANTIPRELRLKTIANVPYLESRPVKEFNSLIKGTVTIKNKMVKGNLNVSEKVKDFEGRLQLKLESENYDDFTIVLANDLGEELEIGYDKKANSYYIDRTRSGQTAFEKGFGAKHIANRITNNNKLELTLLIDVASVELFADGYLNVMTDIFFPNQVMNKVYIKSNKGIYINKLSCSNIKRIWK